MNWRLALLLFSISCAFSLKGQTSQNQKRPKIGLVLSGGGAKGFAHVGVIKVLEEAGIRPDYVTGTSMGSIIGALYAAGYSAEQMQEISRNADWGAILSNEVSLDNIAVEEKYYYSRWITNLSIEKGKFILPSGLIDGQELQLYLSRYTRSLHSTEKFEDYPIPFTCVATNIATGEAVDMDSGSVVTAIRASMAIPSVFTPVYRENKLLVDGGLVRNLPVQEVLDMGADIVISVFVSSGLEPKEDLKTAADILEQSSFILSAFDSREQKKLTDYYIEPEFNGYGVMDFTESDTLIALGEIAARKQMNQFKKLAQEIYGNSEPIAHENLEIQEKYRINEVYISGNDRVGAGFIRSKFGVDTTQFYHIDEIEKKVRELYGTRYFDKVTYILKDKGDGTFLIDLEVIESPPSRLNFSIFYNTETYAGIGFNYMNRGDWFKNSRIAIEGALAENPRLGFQFFQYTGGREQWAFSGGFNWKVQNDFIWFNTQGTESRYRYTDSYAYIGFQKTGSLKKSYGVNVKSTFTNLNPRVNQDTVLENYSEHMHAVNFWIEYNTLNKVYFSSKGWNIKFNGAFAFNAGSQAELKTDQSYWEDIFNERSKVEPYAWVDLSVENYAPISKRVSIWSGLSLISSTEDSLTMIASAGKLGGLNPILNRGVSFWGEEIDKFVNHNLFVCFVGAQWNIYPKLYATGRVNYANPTYPMIFFNPYTKEGSFETVSESYSDIWGGGISLGYESALGPMILGVHQSSREKSPTWYFQIGYSLGK